MYWGHMFGWVHIVMLIIAVLISLGLYFILRKRSAKTQTIVLGILSFSGIAGIICNLVMWNCPLAYLPFHLCSLNALILPIAVFTRNKILNNLTLLWCLGAAFALIVTEAFANYKIPSWAFVIYYFPHVLELAIPILMFVFKLVERDAKCIITSLVITLVTFTIVHFINVGLNSYFIAHNILDTSGNILQVNYIYTIHPENPLLELFYSIIPHSYWYMMFAIPIIVVYLVLIYIDKIIIAIKNRKVKKHNKAHTN